MRLNPTSSSFSAALQLLLAGSRVLVAGLLIYLVSYLYRDASFIWSVPAPFIPFIAILVLIVFAARVPVAASAYFVAGALSVIWSLAPGHTLVNTLWEALYIAVLAVSRSLPAYLALNGVFLLLGLEQSLILDIFGLTQYFSGSVHYLAGAQGLLFLPVCLALSIRTTRPYLRGLLLIAAGLSLFLVLNSGSRAVYLPLLVTLAPLAWRLWREADPKAFVLAAVAPLAIVAAVNFALPGTPIQSAAGIRFAATATSLSGTQMSTGSGQAVEASTAVEDGVRSRLKMWHQAASIGFLEPFGTGAGTFRDVVHAYQLYSSVGFSSAHNVFLEVFATGGWLRLLLLLTLLLPAWIRGWNSDRWAYALGSLALWMTLSFDITAQIPAIMALGFASIGPLYGDTEPAGEAIPAPLSNSGKALAAVSIAVALGTSIWWYLPCGAPECVTSRYLGFRPYVRTSLDELVGDQRVALTQEAVRLNPKSLWAQRAHLQASVSSDEKLSMARELALRFPKADPDLYLQWAEQALAAGDFDQAGQAIRTGLIHFPPEHRPAGVPVASRGHEHANWLDRANEIRQLVEQPQ